MEVKEAIKNIKMFHFKNLPRFKPELIDLLKSLEAENKKYKNILKELEQARGKRIGKNMSDVIDGFEKQGKKLDLEKRGLILVNMALKKENKAYKGMWKMLSGIANRETDTSFESELFRTIEIIENHYLGGGE